MFPITPIGAGHGTLWCLKSMILVNPCISSLWTDKEFHFKDVEIRTQRSRQLAQVHITSKHCGWDMNPGLPEVNTQVLSSAILRPRH